MLTRLNKILKGERGFTLIELLAVMAIVAVLAGIVSTSVSGASNSSVVAAARQDASTLTSSAGDFFSDQGGTQVITLNTVTVTALFNSETVGDVAATTQAISDRWPEKFITEELTDFGDATTSPYVNEFPTEKADTNGLVVRVFIREKDEPDGTPGADISRSKLLERYTAMDFDILVSEGYTESAPDSSVKTTRALDEDFHNFLWLFRKSTTAGASGTDDSRVIVLFKLISAEIFDGSPNDTVELTYKQVH